MRGRARSSACAALLVASWCAGGTASAAGEPPTWSCEEVPADTPDGPACERSAWIVAPCAAVGVPREDLSDCAQAEADLEAERRDRARAAAAAERVQTVLTRQRDSARGERDSCREGWAGCRAELVDTAQPTRWTLPRLVGVAVAGAGALLAGVACATVRGEGERAAACGAAGLGLGVVVGLSW